MNIKSIALSGAYAATIPAANWMIGNVGTQHFPGGPHTIPVGFGYDAPSGVLAVGAALFLRDFLQRVAGKAWTLVAIAFGVCVSFALADPAIAVASAVAFALSELADFGVYTPLSSRSRPLAVLVSGTVGAVVDSVLFLQLAFGSTMFWQGQVIGKTYMAIVGAVLIWGWQRAVPDREPARQSVAVQGA